ncbi:MAG: exopolyphosphatase [Desulfovibrio sp.]
MRLVTRADFDGLACAVLLTELGLMDNWLFVHPKDVQDGKYPGLPDDVVCNVPYIPGCGYWFDHHSSEEQRLAGGVEFQGAARPAPSCARLVWEHFGGEKRFGPRFNEMLHFVDKVDSGDLNLTEILHPEGWVLLGFIMDPRTGLGRYRYFSISNYRLMEDLIEYIRSMPVAEILEQPDVAERVERYFMQETHFRAMLLERITLHGNVLVLDTRGMDEVPPGNRFTMYSLFPECNVSIQLLRGRAHQNTVLSVGHSILNRTCGANIGRLMLRYGGGGHFQVGTCQVPDHLADEVLEELLQELDENNVSEAQALAQG